MLTFIKIIKFKINLTMFDQSKISMKNKTIRITCIEKIPVCKNHSIVILLHTKWPGFMMYTFIH